MTKRQKLEKLDDLLLDRMLKVVASGDTEGLKELGPTITYLKNNLVSTPPKEASTMHDEISDIVNRNK